MSKGTAKPGFKPSPRLEKKVAELKWVKQQLKSDMYEAMRVMEEARKK